MKSIATLWTQHLKDPQQKQEFEKLLRHSGMSLGRLRTILLERLKELDSTETKSEAYDNPNWAYKQADVNGMKRGYRNVIQLLSFLEKE